MHSIRIEFFFLLLLLLLSNFVYDREIEVKLLCDNVVLTFRVKLDRYVDVKTRRKNDSCNYFFLSTNMLAIFIFFALWESLTMREKIETWICDLYSIDWQSRMNYWMTNLLNFALRATYTNDTTFNLNYWKNFLRWITLKVRKFSCCSFQNCLFVNSITWTTWLC